MILQNINTYPIKSLGGIVIEQALVKERGLEYDRRWMIVDDNGRCLTQRELPLMADLKCSIDKERLIVSSISRPELVHQIPLKNRHMPDRITVKVFDSTFDAGHVGIEHDNFFTEAIGQSCRFVFIDSESKRNTNRLITGNPIQVSFADAYPYLIISQASLDDLNQRLAEPVSMNRFRPNLVINGMDPYQEDTLKDIGIGNIRFRIVKQCARCVLTTVDPETYLKGKEPLATLSGYRSVGNQVMFGVNAIAIDYGKISVTDSVEIL